MKKSIRNPIWIAAICSLILCGKLYSSEEQDQTRNMGSTDQIFKEIMMTLPQEKQNEIKAANQKMEQKSLSEKEVEAAREQMREKESRALDELPEEMKEKVEKTIMETEKRLEERRLQVKELKRGKN